MSRPPELSSPTGRFLGAFVGFLALIGAGVAWLTYSESALTESKETDTKASTAIHSAEQPEPLFYKRLGTSPASVQTSPPAKGQRTTGDGFTLEIKITETRDEAEQLIDRLRQKGVDAYYTPIAIRGRVQYRVRYGMYTDMESAGAASRKISQAHDIKNKVIKLR